MTFIERSFSDYPEMYSLKISQNSLTGKRLCQTLFQ